MLANINWEFSLSFSKYVKMTCALNIGKDDAAPTSKGLLKDYNPLKRKCLSLIQNLEIHILSLKQE